MKSDSNAETLTQDGPRGLLKDERSAVARRKSPIVSVVQNLTDKNYEDED